MKPAVIKFNGGSGALLCNKCGVIIAEGFKHFVKEPLCHKCKPQEGADERAKRMSELAGFPEPGMLPSEIIAIMMGDEPDT